MGEAMDRAIETLQARIKLMPDDYLLKTLASSDRVSAGKATQIRRELRERGHAVKAISEEAVQKHNKTVNGLLVEEAKSRKLLPVKH